ncbi:EAL domain-containing protein [Anoxybacillus rupiensis]|uniref:EAL domain-containing protein n=2 Tax=Anoxybacillaceae TaxID=3120669 RepID=A0ABD5IR27_9BACL|nr:MULTISPECIES: bifunctional diguanylate cyclase/phosphodiesterase [Anoxybacillus]MBB3906368.1 diguanylate cyclase (GGDEF)-like protein/PAS domain S-box-containing protein [Anoxybacillus rupiensis]MBS2770648.1 EAL domain-containing protein [Anoxybacillus rupiensis]MDE8564365.1 EAL domain-containing protein [Anoxybacillus rupiensis]MED5050289.1 EAL domain-containing protein [Anoxybacillus rupiensis]QHC03497.1 EAL domain-containing protein [Anoxybacillus sp. PDR2]
MKHNQFVEKLLADEQLWFTVMDQLFDIVFLMKVEEGPRFRYVHVSPKALHLASLAEEDMGKCIDDIYPKSVADHLNSRYRKVVETKGVVTYRDRMNVTNEKRTAESTLIPIVDETGAVSYILSLTRDVTELMRKEEQYDEIYQLFHSLFTHSHDAFIMFDLSGRILRVNRELEQLVGWKQAELLEKDIAQFLPEYRLELEKSLRQLQAGKSLTSLPLSLANKNGKKVYVSVNVTPLFGKNGDVIAGLSIIKNVTDLVEVQEQLRRSEELYRKVVEFLPDTVMIQVNGIITYMNPAGLKMVNAKQVSEVKGKKINDFLKKADSDRDEWIMTSLNGEEKVVKVNEMTIPYYRKKARFLVIHDLSEQKSKEKEIAFMVQYDSLTGLANRNYLSEKLKEFMLAYKNVAVLLIDIHRFKFINDFLGYLNGDELLRKVANRLKEFESERTFLARISEDEFVVAFVYDQKDELRQLLDKLDACLQEPYFIAGEKLNITTNIGVSYAADAERSVETLLSNAHKAVYYAKMNGTNRIVEYDPHMRDIFAKKVRLENDLQQAIENGEFSLYYQPKVNVVSGTLSVESLIRWKHPQLGMVSPAEFIPIAEETNRIDEIGKWVLRQACRDLKRLEKAGFPHLKMAVNLSARQFQNKDLEEVVCRILAEENMNPTSFIFEITETAIMKEPSEVIAILQKFKQLGITIAIDDFGVSYSSLNYLNRFPIDAVKIDRSFIRSISEGRKSEEIVEAIILLAHKLNLFVTAEGVETAEQVRFLLEKGCEEIQGYYFSAPVPFEQLLDTLGKVQELMKPWRV